MTAAAVVSCARLITALKQPALDQRAVGERLLAFTRAAKSGASRRAAGSSGVSADAGEHFEQLFNFKHKSSCFACAVASHCKTLAYMIENVIFELRPCQAISKLGQQVIEQQALMRYCCYVLQCAIRIQMRCL
jgi:hypothetical protein